MIMVPVHVREHHHRVDSFAYDSVHRLGEPAGKMVFRSDTAGGRQEDTDTDTAHQVSFTAVSRGVTLTLEQASVMWYRNPNTMTDVSESNSAGTIL
eukprot:COSAG05_NODE_1086_length_5923_cov_254.414492_5_plen_96_part_00